jgi:Nif11 domain
MSEETLRRFLERLNTDEAFRERVKDARQFALEELDLSPAELAAVSTQDEDALRRLVGADVAAYAGQQVGFYTTNLICSWLCFTTIDTPQSGRHCGTGDTACRATACCDADEFLMR